MRLLFIVDGRSPTALNWMAYFLKQGHAVHLVSSFPCQGDERLASLEFIPMAFSGVKPQTNSSGAQTSRLSFWSGAWGAPSLRLRTFLRHWLGPFTLKSASIRLRQVIERVQPDLVHAMRIPYEGMASGLAKERPPLLISVWGNDFTLHAPSTPWMAGYTRQTLRRIDALHTDCKKDMRLAIKWGFSPEKPGLVAPGGGGLQLDLFLPPAQDDNSHLRELRVVNPRGFRAYVRNDTFFRAIPIVLEQLPNTRFICPNMAGEPQAQRWVERLGIADSVELLPQQSRQQMAEVFRNARVAVSPSTHDGTPNTLLEAMACGCLPIAGDLESLREWITPGQNGLLINPGDPLGLAEAVLVGLRDEKFCLRAKEFNIALVTERAEYGRVMSKAEAFYHEVLERQERLFG